MATDLLRALDQRLREAGVVCTFEEATPDAPLPRVLMRLSDEKDVTGVLTVAPDPEILQIFVGFAVEVSRERVAQVARTICAINATLPFGTFELAEHRDLALSFRALAPLVGASWDIERVIGAIGLALGIVGRFVPLVVEVAEGQIDFKEASRRLRAS